MKGRKERKRLGKEGGREGWRERGSEKRKGSKGRREERM